MISIKASGAKYDDIDLSKRFVHRSIELMSIDLSDLKVIYRAFIEKNISKKTGIIYDLKISLENDSKSILVNVRDNDNNSQKILKYYLTPMPFCCGIITLGGFYSGLSDYYDKFDKQDLTLMSVFMTALFDMLWWLNYQSVISTHIPSSKWIALLNKHMTKTNKGISPRTNNVIITYTNNLLKPSFKV